MRHTHTHQHHQYHYTIIYILPPLTQHPPPPTHTQTRVDDSVTELSVGNLDCRDDVTMISDCDSELMTLSGGCTSSMAGWVECSETCEDMRETEGGGEGGGGGCYCTCVL